MTREEISKLAGQVVWDRLSRAVIVDTTAKGRIVTELVGEPTEAERRWEALQAKK